MKLFGVVGLPVLHSKSPLIHRAGYEAQDLSASYLRIAARDPKHALKFCGNLGLGGFNVTAPFKQGILELVSKSSAECKATGAANTILLRGGEAHAFNTDVDGVIGAVMNSGLDVRDLPVLILGAGGAARAAAYALCKKGAKVWVTNRTAKNACQLAKQLGVGTVEFDSPALAEMVRRVGLIINTVSADINLRCFTELHDKLSVLDAVYTAESSFIKSARLAGSRVIDGREWLLYQGAKAYELFVENDAPLDAMRRALYNNALIEPKRIALVGMMGVGKSTTALELGVLLNRSVREIDSEVEAMAGQSIAKLCNERGEEEFRRIEGDVLAKALSNGPAIISCGGGVVGGEANRKNLSDRTLVMWLCATTSEILTRLKDISSRPLLCGPSPSSRLDQLLVERKPLYAQLAQLVVDTEGISPTDVANRIAYEINAAWSS